MIDIALKIIVTPFIIIALMCHSFCVEQIYQIFYSNRWLYLNSWKRIDTWTYIVLIAYLLTILGLSYFYCFWFLLGLLLSGFICFYIIAISYM